MNNFEYSVICIDFRDFSSAEELDNFFEDTGLDMNGSSWFDLHLGKWIVGTIINKIWVDLMTLKLVAYETETQQMIYPAFAQHLNEMKPIDRSFKYDAVVFEDPEDISLDDILDKILVSGTASLTEFEKSFLEQQSKLS
jgi:hypothetical protein